MKKGAFLFIATFFFSSYVFSQDLFNENIQNLISQKRSVYYKSGIFTKNSEGKEKSTLKSIRHFYSKQEGYERVVLDFNKNDLPRIYSYFSKEKNKVYIDLFGTALDLKIKSTGHGLLVKNLIFYPLSDEHLSIEVDLNKPIECEMFFLVNPGRLVLDIKS